MLSLKEQQTSEMQPDFISKVADCWHVTDGFLAHCQCVTSLAELGRVVVGLPRWTSCLHNLLGSLVKADGVFTNVDNDWRLCVAALV